MLWSLKTVIKNVGRVVASKEPVDSDQKLSPNALVTGCVQICRGMWNSRHQDHAWSGAANALFNKYIYTVAFFVLPEALALSLFIIPFVRNTVEKSRFRVFYYLTWWFQVCTL